LDLASILDLQDLIGIRVIVQFTRDLSVVHGLINNHFAVSDVYDTSQRLKEDQFGYSSHHFILSLPEAWLKVPSLSKLGTFRAEVQLRTTAQHIWAVASHTLQYKHESSIPPAIRRAIHRVAALLETVDLEFDRVLSQRDQYRSDVDITVEAIPLNVDLLEKTLDSLLPLENKHECSYEHLLHQLTSLGINTVADLTSLIKKHKEAIIAIDKKIVAMLRRNKDCGYEYDPARTERGVFYAFSGLVRQALELEFGEDWRSRSKPISRNTRPKTRRTKR
jgi:hypothetical protein